MSGITIPVALCKFINCLFILQISCRRGLKLYRAKPALLKPDLREFLASHPGSGLKVCLGFQAGPIPQARDPRKVLGLKI